MQLQNIDKTLYRQRLNRIIISFILSLTLLSLLFGSLFISVFSDNSINFEMANNTDAPSNFSYNLAGVICALVVCAALLHRLRKTAYFHQVYYVWQLKQLHNKIYRKLNIINNMAMENGDHQALIILNFYYQSLKQVYQLDDNTLTMSSVNQKHQAVKEKAEQQQLQLDKEQFTENMLKDITQGEEE
ncbi:DUF3087 family protein [Thalassotalea sp. PP2-459]|uniref:DUF3087 family protein n=1 Tax=Thalassotalea sp. PP2-459 TaxID=1742724 RepID=UPI00094250FB|nr:DUF3087 family protein [Thalassotalea sp. PP2-459]OKY24940.1 hypothetical protein BI291_04255 [Thalassotalea sp. PP2-459]